MDAELAQAKSGKFGVGFITWALERAPKILTKALQYLKSCSIRHGIPASCRTQLSSSLASTWITAQHMPRHRSMEKESDRPQLAEKTLDSGAGPETFACTGHEGRCVAVRARLSCWAFWSRASVIHVQGTISKHAAIQSFYCFLGLSLVCHLHECKSAWQPGVAIHDDMNLHHVSVGFEQPPKLLVCHLRTPGFQQRGFSGTFPLSVTLIVGSCRSIRQEDEVERAASPCFCFSVPPSHSCRTCDV